MEYPDTYGFATRAIHAGQDPDPATGAVIVPIYQTSTFAQSEVGVHKGYEYARTGNPTRTALETALAALDGGRYALAFASGLAAETTALLMLSSGDHIVAGDDAYGGTYRLFDKVFKQLGVVVDYVDTRDPENVADAILPATRLVWIETPTNPLLKLADIRAISAHARARGVLTLVDNTFASPYLQRPLELGADIVLYSTTKYLGGHSDVVGGALVLNDETVYNRLKFLQNAAGAVPGPFDSWLVLRGLKTLALRMRAHSENALAIATMLEQHPAVEQVIYPGLESFAQHELAKRQMSGFGAVVSFEVKGGKEGAWRFIDATRVISITTNLGDSKTTIAHPATTSHGRLSAQEREAAGIRDSLIRVAVGLEDVADLQADLARGLAAL